MLVAKVVLSWAWQALAVPLAHIWVKEAVRQGVVSPTGLRGSRSVEEEEEDDVRSDVGSDIAASRSRQTAPSLRKRKARVVTVDNKEHVVEDDDDVDGYGRRRAEPARGWMARVRGITAQKLLYYMLMAYVAIQVTIFVASALEEKATHENTMKYYEDVLPHCKTRGVVSLEERELCQTAREYKEATRKVSVPRMMFNAGYERIKLFVVADSSILTPVLMVILTAAALSLGVLAFCGWRVLVHAGRALRCLSTPLKADEDGGEHAISLEVDTVVGGAADAPVPPASPPPMPQQQQQSQPVSSDNWLADSSTREYVDPKDWALSGAPADFARGPTRAQAAPRAYVSHDSVQ